MSRTLILKFPKERVKDIGMGMVEVDTRLTLEEFLLAYADYKTKKEAERCA